MKFRIIKKIFGGKNVYYIERRYFFLFWSIVCCEKSEWPVKFKTIEECESYIHDVVQKTIQEKVEEQTSVSIPVYQMQSRKKLA